MGAGVWNKVKNFFRDVGNGMQIVLKPVSQILSMIPNTSKSNIKYDT